MSETGNLMIAANYSNSYTKRIFDLLFAGASIPFLLPIMGIVAVLVKLESYGPVFFVQTRIGRNGKSFPLYKFRSMRVNAEKNGQLTIGTRDLRVTRIGYYLRKYKIDELPQLMNVLKGDMSIVGPRPEVMKYVKMYNEEQKIVLSIKPGITDLASLAYSNENRILQDKENPEEFYVNHIVPDKLRLNLEYLRSASLPTDINIIFCTLKTIFKR